MSKPNLREAQRLMDDLFRQEYEVPRLGKCSVAYGKTFSEIKTGFRTSRRERNELQPDQISRLREDYLNGIPIADIAHKFGVHKATVGHHTDDLPRRVHHTEMTEGLIKQIREMYLAGETNIWLKLGLDKTTVTKYTKDLPPRRKAKATIEAPMRKEARERFLRGVAQAEIARSFGVSEGVIGRFVKDLRPKVEKKKKLDVDLATKKARSAYQAGVPVKEIAVDIGYSVGWVQGATKGLPRRMVKRSTSEIRKIQKLYRKGLPRKEIGKLIGISESLVGRYAKDEPRRRVGNYGKPPSSPKTIELIRELYLKGTPVDEIAAQAGIDRATLYKHVKDLPKRPQALSDELVSKMKKLLSRGVPRPKIAKVCGVSIAAVYKYVPVS